jgi:hypothetical protein
MAPRRPPQQRHLNQREDRQYVDDAEPPGPETWMNSDRAAVISIATTQIVPSRRCALSPPPQQHGRRQHQRDQDRQDMQPDDGRNMPPLRMTAPQGRQDCDEQDRCAGGQQAIRATRDDG